ncbi:hypothetical protein [Pseudoprimorskyibacter insulae]|uniref:Uncharacterized protein n=1 Tax=Pseudoprimorskyibacter insulae TaxID=1695997 RepID=A0A2R8AZB3_9RHOB|nr:hypothetical protein [Pseudoprimorskyibacter insulae]SPF81350.1 hypothetical protein PRI8871_03173 [Pseudoprimorskyibacter insulae]
MSKTIYGITEAELFRLKCAYSAVRDPIIRAEFLRTVEAWAHDQWNCSGKQTQK